MKIYTGKFYGVSLEGFPDGLTEAIYAVNAESNFFASDNLFTFSKNLSLLSDSEFMAAFEANIATDNEHSIIWRTYVLAWAARHAVNLEGDFVECGCYKGTTAKIICDLVDFKKQNRKYYLYDLFDHEPDMLHPKMPEHSKELYPKTKERFQDYPNVLVTQGKVPDILHEVAPDKIAMMHIDLNNAEAEIGALDILFDRMVPGAVLVLDDYGWNPFLETKIAEDKWLGERGYFVLELPTGQGLVFKR